MREGGGGPSFVLPQPEVEFSVLSRGSDHPIAPAGYQPTRRKRKVQEQQGFKKQIHKLEKKNRNLIRVSMPNRPLQVRNNSRGELVCRSRT